MSDALTMAYKNTFTREEIL